jgi:hypothetical protein
MAVLSTRGCAARGRAGGREGERAGGRAGERVADWGDGVLARVDAVLAAAGFGFFVGLGFFVAIA